MKKVKKVKITKKEAARLKKLAEDMAAMRRDAPPQKEKKFIKLKKSMAKKFYHWMNERHRIYLARKNGDKFPWTKDKILRKYKFTNVFRQLDRVTTEWTARYARLLGTNPSLGDILFYCGMFRLFNWPETYDALKFGLNGWDEGKAVELLTKRKDEGHQIFTGAYIIPNAGRTDPKIEVICEAVDMLSAFRHEMADEIHDSRSIERAVEVLQQIPTIGGFIAYEIVCDLRFTKVLADAKDKLTWANPGPGAMRGIHRMMTGKRKWPEGKPRPDYVEAMRTLFSEVVFIQDFGKPTKEIYPNGEWPFEMREIEHSLCEFDKYMRVKKKEGKPRSKFVPEKARKDLPKYTKKEISRMRKRIRKEQKAQGRELTVWNIEKKGIARKLAKAQKENRNVND